MAKNKDKSEDKKYVVVDAVSTFHMRYVVELDSSDPEHFAHDIVTMQKAKEFSQRHLDEVIVTSQEVDKEKALSMARKEHPHWALESDEKLMEVFVTAKEKKDSQDKVKKSKNKIK